jgi:membrane dipeptidase
MNPCSPRPLARRLVPLLPLAGIVLAASSLVAQDDAALVRARKVLRKHPVVDGHNDLPWQIREVTGIPGDVDAYDLRKRTSGATDLERLRQGGVGGQFWSVYTPAEAKGDFLRTQLEQIDVARRVVARYPRDLVLTGTADEMERAMKAGRIASLLGVEGGHAIENSLPALRSFYDLGVRYMTLTHTKTLDWADAAGDVDTHGGLTRFGEEVVREMNRLGMLVDLSHVTPATMEDALRVSEAPVIFSHSSARALCDHVRNVPDDVLRQLPKNDGIVMVTFVASFVSEEYRKATEPLWAEVKKRTEGMTDAEERQRVYKEVMSRAPKVDITIGQVADHIEHVRKVAGVDHVGLGGDYDGNDTWPQGLEDVSGYPRLFAELVRRGWSDADLAKLADRNLLRVLRSAEATARRLQASRPASIATIQKLDAASASR